MHTVRATARVLPEVRASALTLVSSHEYARGVQYTTVMAGAMRVVDMTCWAPVPDDVDPEVFRAHTVKYLSVFPFLSAISVTVNEGISTPAGAIMQARDYALREGKWDLWDLLYVSPEDVLNRLPSRHAEMVTLLAENTNEPEDTIKYLGSVCDDGGDNGTYYVYRVTWEGDIGESIYVLAEMATGAFAVVS